MVLFSILFLASGFAALVYETLWFRHLGLIFGNTVQAASTVLTAFMLGIAIGSRLAAVFVPKMRRPLRVFGLVVMAIGGYALCVPWLLGLLRPLYGAVYAAAGNHVPLLTALRFGTAVVFLLLPTVLMGMTLPLLAQGLLRRAERFGGGLGLLYGVNTLGSVLGVLLSGFLLLPRLGLARTNLLAAAVSLLAGAAAVALSAVAPFRHAPGAAVSGAAADGGAAGSRRRLVVFAAASGFLALGLEVVWFRALILVFGSTTYSFAAMLAVFLFGLALGAACLSWLGDRARNTAALFAMVQFLAGIYTLASLSWFAGMQEFVLAQLARYGLRWGVLLASKFVVTLAFLLVPTLLFGMALPLLAAGARRLGATAAGAAGRVYAWNTVGAAGGAFVLGFVLLPRIGIFNCLVLLAVGSVLLAVLAAALAETRRRALAMAGTGAAVCAAVVLLASPRWDAKALAAGPYFAPWNFIRDGKIILRSRLASERLLFYKEGATATVSTTLAADEEMFFCMDGKVEADTSPRSMTLQRLMGHLPMLLHANPRRAVNIGLGAGVTLGALGCYPLDHYEVVEIEPVVKHVARLWGGRNHNVLDRQDLKITINDGRNHMLATREVYDVITSDPFEPVMTGAAALYTVEHFEICRRRLAAGGVMAQYLPLYELSGRDCLTIIRSFVRAFPQSLLFFTGFDTILIGFRDGIRLDPGAMRARMAIPAAQASLAEIGFKDHAAILGLMVTDMSQDRALAGAGPLNTDDRPIIEFSAPLSALRYMPDRNQELLLEHFTAFPEGWTAALAPEDLDSMRRGRSALRDTLRAGVLREEGKGEECVELLLQAVTTAPENPVIRTELVATVLSSADNLRLSGKLADAFFQYQIAAHYSPREFWALYYLATLAMRAGKADVAQVFLDRALAAYPRSPMMIALRGRYRGTLGDIAGAVADLRQAIDKLPERRDLWEDYALFLAAAGDARGAAAAREKAGGLPE
ncbi:MAG: spermidine synthase [Lentisphaerae bacterium]|nr:spermidine synthase [Lentisphaerota bacterium]